MSQYDLNKRFASERGYKVVSSPYGHVAMDKKGKWFTPAYKKETEAWEEIFKQLGLPGGSDSLPYTQEYTLDFGNSFEDDQGESWFKKHDDILDARSLTPGKVIFIRKPSGWEKEE